MFSAASLQSGAQTLLSLPQASLRGLAMVLRSILGLGAAPYSQAGDDRAPLGAFHLISPHLLRDREVHVVERPGNGLFTEALGVASAALDLRWQGSLADLSASLSGRRTNPVVVVDIDAFQSTSEAVDGLLALRAAYPRAAVVIGSAFFARHDFSGERRAIADASIRLPIGRAAMALAISSAIANNDATAQRC